MLSFDMCVAFSLRFEKLNVRYKKKYALLILDCELYVWLLNADFELKKNLFFYRKKKRCEINLRASKARRLDEADISLELFIY